MKKQIEFTSFYNLVTNIMSDVHEDKTINDVADEITKEATGEKEHDMASVYANVMAYCHKQIMQMEAMRADIYIQMSFKVLKTLKEDDGDIRSFESYLQHIVGLDTMALRYDVEKDEYILGFLFEQVKEQFTPIRIQLLFTCVKELLQRDADLNAYPRQRLKDFLSQLISAGTEIEGCEETLQEAINILNNESRFSDN